MSPAPSPSGGSLLASRAQDGTVREAMSCQASCLDCLLILGWKLQPVRPASRSAAACFCLCQGHVHIRGSHVLQRSRCNGGCRSTASCMGHGGPYAAAGAVCTGVKGGLCEHERATRHLLSVAACRRCLHSQLSCLCMPALSYACSFYLASLSWPYLLPVLQLLSQRCFVITFAASPDGPGARAAAA